MSNAAATKILKAANLIATVVRDGRIFVRDSTTDKPIYDAPWGDMEITVDDAEHIVHRATVIRDHYATH